MDVLDYSWTRVRLPPDPPIVTGPNRFDGLRVFSNRPFSIRKIYSMTGSPDRKLIPCLNPSVNGA